MSTKELVMLGKAVKFLRNSLLEDLGYPTTLIDLLREDSGLNRHLVENDKGIGAYEIVHWNEFGNLLSEDHFHRQRLNGWTRCRHSYPHQMTLGNRVGLSWPR